MQLPRCVIMREILQSGSGLVSKRPPPPPKRRPNMKISSRYQKRDATATRKIPKNIDLKVKYTESLLKKYH